MAHELVVLAVDDSLLGFVVPELLVERLEDAVYAGVHGCGNRFGRIVAGIGRVASGRRRRPGVGRAKLRFVVLFGHSPGSPLSADASGEQRLPGSRTLRRGSARYAPAPDCGGTSVPVSGRWFTCRRRRLLVLGRHRTRRDALRHRCRLPALAEWFPLWCPAGVHLSGSCGNTLPGAGSIRPLRTSARTSATPGAPTAPDSPPRGSPPPPCLQTVTRTP